MEFEFSEDEMYFAKLFSSMGGLDSHLELFDFRPPTEKRQEFNRMRDTVFNGLIQNYGDSCQLKYHNDCSGIAKQVDHLIPLASNKLNKELRQRTGQEGKKVPPQSFGSNHISNFVLSCPRCNSAKKHRIPQVELIERIIAIRGFA
jgi:5-methylcytosine-specific restriction endonuclease McrA